MNKIPTQAENPTGLHQRYNIRKITGGGRLISTDKESEYFVLRLDEGGKDPEHIKACRIGVNAYADAIAHHLPELAKDLKEHYPVNGKKLEDYINLYNNIQLVDGKLPLRKLSDMTEEENIESGKYQYPKLHEFKPFPVPNQNQMYRPELFRYLLSKHFDLFGLIESGLAIDKTKIHNDTI